MSQQNQRHEITTKTVLYRTNDFDAVTVRRDLPYPSAESGTLTMDLFDPPEGKSEVRRPAVVFVIGYPDPGARAILGCQVKEMESYIAWGRLVAASGMVAITYTNREPATDVHALLRYVRQNAASLGIDETRIGVWACSGNVPLALSLLMKEGGEYLKCAVLCYGYMLDLEGSTGVAEAAKTWRFANPCAGKPVDDLSPDIPLFVARAGRDENLHLNETLDHFLAKAVSGNLPLTFVNHAAGPHAFDLFHDSELTREIIRQILGFLRFHLLA